MPAAAFSVIGALVASRRPANPIGWMFCAAGVGSALQLFGLEYAAYGLVARPGSLPGAELAAWVANWAWVPVFGTIPFLLLLFPDGRLLSKRWAPVLWVASAGVAINLTREAVAATFAPFPNVLNPLAVPRLARALGALTGELVWFGAAVLAAASLVLRFHRSRGEERQQMKWFVFGGAIVTLGLLQLAVAVTTTSFNPPKASQILGVLCFAALPATTGMAILRHRLYDIDVVITRTVAYAALAGFITAVYVAIVVGLGAALGAGDELNPALSIAATAVVAAAFQPVKMWVKRLANRLVYGDRATPYEVMASFSARMAAALSVEEVLPRMAEAAAAGLAAERVRVRVFLPRGDERSFTWPKEASLRGFELVVSVTVASETVGEIALSKAAGEPITPAEEALLSALASQAGPAMRNVSLTVELESRLAEISAQAAAIAESRRRLYFARDAEQRRIERDIHEGTERLLVELSADVREATALMERNPTEAAALLDDISVRASEALELLREIARGIYPPLLVDQGLVPALEAHIRKWTPAASLEVEEPARARFDPQAEAAVYFCCAAALKEAARSGAREVDVSLWLDHTSLAFAVRRSGDARGAEEGEGSPDSVLLDMVDRVEALGGRLDLARGGDGSVTVSGSVPAAFVSAPGGQNRAAPTLAMEARK